MTTRIKTMMMACAATMALGAAPVHSAAHGEMDLSGWHEASQKAAKHMMDTYGPPAEMTDTMLIWHETGPWVKTIIYKDATTHNFPMEHPDVMQQWVHMDVPPELFDELAMYDGSVVVNRTEALISARCDKEGANFLAINLAHDIVSGERSVEEARDFYAETIKKVMNGEKPEYTTGFTFEVTDENLSNPDESVIDM